MALEEVERVVVEVKEEAPVAVVVRGGGDGGGAGGGGEGGGDGGNTDSRRRARRPSVLLCISSLRWASASLGLAASRCHGNSALGFPLLVELLDLAVHLLRWPSRVVLLLLRSRCNTVAELAMCKLRRSAADERAAKQMRRQLGKQVLAAPQLP